jgi:hypothetical protein
LLFELKHLKRKEVPDPTSPAGKEKIATKLSEAMEQIRKYSFAKEFAGKKVTAWAIVFASEKCVERVKVHVEE